MTRIGHYSDLHGHIDKFLSDPRTAHVYAFAGDMMPNYCSFDERREHSDNGVDWRQVEIDGQTAWVEDHAEEIKARLGGRPVVCVSGNHDYVDMAAIMKRHGINAHSVDNGAVVEEAGHRWAGFREVRWIQGDWVGEVRDFREQVDRLVGQDPDIALCHIPPAGILDTSYDGLGDGCREIVNAIAYYRFSNLAAYLCGHVHGEGGQVVDEMGVTFSNAAGMSNYIDID